MRTKPPRTYADLLLDGLIVGLLLFGALLTLAVLLPPELGRPVDPLSPDAARPPWYFLPIYSIFRALPLGAGIAALLALFALLFAAPLLDRSRSSAQRWLVRLLGLLVLLLVIWLGVRGALGREEPEVPAEQQEQGCLVCHSEIKVDYIESAHAGFGVDCVACHGGDPTTLEMDLAHDRGRGYRGTPSRAQIPLLCASCHASPSLMTPYGLRTDQFIEYLTSKHGVRWTEGKTQVAVCTDCHTAHLILPAYDPRSTVNPANIPSTCARCHDNAQLMKLYGLPVGQMEAFRRGVHGVALLEEGTTKAPSCATCHGTHGAAPPGVEDITKVCGTCHINERLYFNESPHKRAMDERGISECASCHDNHDIEPASTGRLFDVVCARCHAPGSKEASQGEKLKTLIVGAQQALGEAEEALRQAEREGYDVSPYRSRMVEARAYVIESLPVQHSLDIAQVQERTRRARSIAEDVRAGVHSLMGARGVRTLGLVIVWGYLILMLLVALLYRRERRRG
jgi:hypothetical protein